MRNRQILLKPEEIPRQWYNILADIKMNPPLGRTESPFPRTSWHPCFP
jgi:tryptophan synthase beta chain